MKNLNIILLTIISLIMLVSVNAATVSHPASEITAGIFDPGDFTITNNKEVFLSIKNTEAGGREYGLVSAGSIGGIGVGKFSIYDSTAGKSRLTIDDSGNIGIGTTSPKTKLDVEGLVRVGRFSSKPTCNANTIGAFVFDTTANKPYVCASGGWKPLDSDNDKDGLIEWLDPNDNSFNPQCSADNGGQCYLSQGSKSGLDGDLAAGNIKSGVNIFGFTGTLASGTLIKETSFRVRFQADYRLWKTVVSPFNINSGSSYACTYGVLVNAGGLPYCNNLLTRMMCNGVEMYSNTAYKPTFPEIILEETPIFSADSDTSCIFEVRSPCEPTSGGGSGGFAYGWIAGSCYSTDG